MNPPRRSESALIHACLRFLQLQGCMAWRNNSGVMRQDAPGRRSRFIRFGGIVGAPDILGVAPNGQAICVEAKCGKTPVTQAQQEFLDEVAKRGAFALVVRDSVEALVQAWEART